MRELQKTFEAAFEQYSDELFRHASMRLKDRERAVELTQECFLKVFEYAQKGDKEIVEMRPFLYRTLRHLIIDEYRRKKSVSLDQMVEGSDDERSVEDLMPQDESNTLERAIERFDGKRVLECLQELPEPYREAVSLRYVGGLNPKEIAEIVGESENVVSVRVHRGLAKLKALMQDKNHDGQS